jgi:hypothetical protein
VLGARGEGRGSRSELCIALLCGALRCLVTRLAAGEEAECSLATRRRHMDWMERDISVSPNRD